MRVETEKCFSLIFDIFLKDAIKVFEISSGYDEFFYQFNVDF
jgi:hypothetical protein